jgi:hypothetical protein
MINCVHYIMVNIPGIPLLAVQETDSYLLPALKVILIISLIGYLVFYLLRTRVYRRGIPGRKLSFSERLIPGKIRISLSGDRTLNPSYIMMVVRNTGKREIDLDAPVLTFIRWRSKRMFRILSVRESDIYPIYMEPGEESVVNISLQQFYNDVPELKRACRLSVEMKDDTGRKFKSSTIRLKWL